MMGWDSMMDGDHGSRAQMKVSLKAYLKSFILVSLGEKGYRDSGMGYAVIRQRSLYSLMELPITIVQHVGCDFLSQQSLSQRNRSQCGMYMMQARPYSILVNYRQLPPICRTSSLYYYEKIGSNMFSEYSLLISFNCSIRQCLRNNIWICGFSRELKLPMPRQCTSTRGHFNPCRKVETVLLFIRVKGWVMNSSCRLRLTSLSQPALPPLVKTFSGFTSFPMCLRFLWRTTIHPFSSSPSIIFIGTYYHTHQMSAQEECASSCRLQRLLKLAVPLEMGLRKRARTGLWSHPFTPYSQEQTSLIMLPSPSLLREKMRSVHPGTLARLYQFFCGSSLYVGGKEIRPYSNLLRKFNWRVFWLVSCSLFRYALQCTQSSVFLYLPPWRRRYYSFPMSMRQLKSPKKITSPGGFSPTSSCRMRVMVSLRAVVLVCCECRWQLMTWKGSPRMRKERLMAPLLPISPLAPAFTLPQPSSMKQFRKGFLTRMAVCSPRMTCVATRTCSVKTETIISSQSSLSSQQMERRSERWHSWVARRMRSGGGQKGRALARSSRDCRGGTEAKRFQVTAVTVRDYWGSVQRLLSQASIDYQHCNTPIMPCWSLMT